MSEQDNLLVDVVEEKTGSHLREMFLLSVIIHLIVILTFVADPHLFDKLFPARQPVLLEVPQKDVTVLYEPPELPKLKMPPKTKVLSDANRMAQPGTDKPVAPTMTLQPPAPPPPPAATKPLGSGPQIPQAKQLPPIGLPNFPKHDEPPEAKTTMEPVEQPKQAPPPSQAQLTLPSLSSPTEGTDQILRNMAKQHASGDGGSGFGGFPQGSGRGTVDPNFSMPGPQILSDTMGVDFNPYLLRIYWIVYRNWISVIPEIARLGRKGKVALEFSIMRDGSVPDLTLRFTSGTDSLDAAALSSIRLSNPFPGLPSEFPGDSIRLRYVYFYNLKIDNQ